MSLIRKRLFFCQITILSLIMINLTHVQGIAFTCIERHNSSLFQIENLFESFAVPTLSNEPIEIETHFFEGDICDPLHTYQKVADDCGPLECAWPGSACYLQSNCGLFTSGKFNWSRYHATTKHPEILYENNLPFCNENKLAFDTDDYGLFYNNLVWLPTSCNLKWFSPEKVVQCMANKIITFTGDSVMRQTFNRLVAFIRGFKQHAERHYHESVVYRYYENHDTLKFQSSIEFNESDPSFSVLNGNNFEIQFIWCPNRLITSKEIEDKKTNILVTSVNYWNKTDIHDTEITNWMTDLSINNRLKNIYWVTSPRVLNEESEYLFRRHEQIRRIFHNNSDLTNGFHLGANFKKTDNNSKKFNILPFYKLALISPWDRSEHIHYGCSFFPSKGDWSIGHPKNGDCRNLINLNLLQILFNQIC